MRPNNKSWKSKFSIDGPTRTSVQLCSKSARPSVQSDASNTHSAIHRLTRQNTRNFGPHIWPSFKSLHLTKPKNPRKYWEYNRKQKNQGTDTSYKLVIGEVGDLLVSVISAADGVSRRRNPPHFSPGFLRRRHLGGLYLPRGSSGDCVSI